MNDREIALLLIGAGIALLSSIVTAVVQHLLSLRADRIKRERDRQGQKKAEIKQSLGQGSTLSQLEGEIEKLTTFLSIGVEEAVSIPEDASELLADLDELPDEPPPINLSSDPINLSVADDATKERE